MAWIAAAIAFNGQPGPTAFLLAIYPLWDAAANLVDARVSGGLKAKSIASAQCRVSVITALALIVAIVTASMPSWPCSGFGRSSRACCNCIRG